MAKPISQKLDQAGMAWFNTLKIKYLALKPLLAQPTPSQMAAISGIDQILLVPEDQLIQPHLAELEDWLIVLLSGAELKQWVNALRDDYREVFGADAFQRIFPTLVPKVDTATDLDLLAETRRLQSELHWHYSIQPWAAKQRKDMMVGILAVLTAVIVCVVIFWVIAEWKSPNNGGMFVSLIIVLGTLGGSISSIQRVQAANFTDGRAVTVARQDQLALGVMLSPLQGALFALLFALLLSAGIVTPGFVVPVISLGSTNCPCSAATRTVGAHAGGIAASVVSSNGEASAYSKDKLTITSNSLTTNGGKAAITGTNEVGETRGGTNQPPYSANDEGKLTTTSPSTASENRCAIPIFNMVLCFKEGKDIALLLIWAFLAGFSERLVPDTLSKMADKAKS